VPLWCGELVCAAHRRQQARLAVLLAKAHVPLCSSCMSGSAYMIGRRYDLGNRQQSCFLAHQGSTIPSIVASPLRLPLGLWI